jgi:prepilin-type N-terminal cleavage/methylation domain-containing protein
MRNAFTLIELMIVISIIAIIATIIIQNIAEKRKAIPGPNPAPAISIQIDGSSYTAHKFILEGHSYFMIGGVRPGFTAVHNPECPKCKSAPMKDVSVEVEKK